MDSELRTDQFEDFSDKCKELYETTPDKVRERAARAGRVVDRPAEPLSLRASSSSSPPPPPPRARARLQTRVVLKYKHGEGKLYMRATNDDVCVMFETDQATEVRKLEKLHQWLMASMCGADPDAMDEAMEEEAAKPQSPKRDKKSKRRK